MWSTTTAQFRQAKGGKVRLPSLGLGTNACSSNNASYVYKYGATTTALLAPVTPLRDTAAHASAGAAASPVSPAPNQSAC